MNLTKEDIASLRPYGNFVLVRSIVSMDTIMLGGEKIFIDTSYKPEHHAEVICEVVAVPRRLVFDRKRHVGESMEWRSAMELHKGDIVWCNYLAVLDGKKRYMLTCDGLKYFMVEYPQIYLKKNKQDITMLNGWVLCEPVYKEKEQVVVDGKTIALPSVTTHNQTQGIARHTQFGKVKYIGRPVKEYYYEDAEVDDDYIRVGDTVMFVTPFNPRLEHELHHHFDGTSLIVSRRSRIMGIVEF
jgi:hypothetical protein